MYAHPVELNKKQRKAVQHGLKQLPRSPAPVLVIAGAGSGKTKVIAARVAQLLVSGVNHNRILLLTFSRRAAEQMIRRVKRVTKKSANGGGVRLRWAGTFHSIAAQLLRRYGSRIGLRSSFTILDRSDSADLMDIGRHDLGLSAKGWLFPKKDTCLAIYSLSINSGRSMKRVLRAKFPSCRRWRKELVELFAAYVAAKRKQNVLDYDDLLLLWLELLKKPKLASEIARLFDHVLVDEYQDTNHLQGKILRKLKPDGRGLMVVGDDAQAIYSFRAATVRNILDFPNQFDPPARVVSLEQNYRSTQPILKACNAVIELAKERFTKNLFSERRSKQKPFLTTVRDESAQARYIAQRILTSREAGVPLTSQAVLFRASHQSAQLEIELARLGIPFVKWGGLKFVEAAHVKDALSVLRWCHNPRDRVAAFRALQLLPGIGPQIASDLFDAFGRKDFVTRLRAANPPRPAAQHWPPFSKLIVNVTKSRDAWPADIERICKWYEPHLPRIYDDADSRDADLKQLAQMAGGYMSREAFLTELAIEPPDTTSGRVRTRAPDGDYTILSTIHSAKGQEWQNVTILNVVEGCIPYPKATTVEDVEEERRLLHVAMTRAKDELDLLIPQHHFTYLHTTSSDAHHFTQRSRFIPNSIQKHFEIRQWSEARSRGRAA